MKDCKELERLLDDNSNNVHHEHKHRHNHHQHHHVHGGGHAHPSFVTQTSNGVSGMCENDRLSHHHHHHVHGGLGHPSFVTQTSNGVSGMCEVDPLSHHHHVHGGHAQTRNGVSGMYEDDPSGYYKYTSVSSPASVFSLQSNGSSSSLFSVGHALSDNGSPTPPSPVEFKSQMSCGTSQYLNGSCLDLKLPDSPLRNRKNTNERLVDELGLCRNLSKMYVSHEQQNSSSFGGFSVGQGRIRLGDGSLNGINQSKVDNYSVYRNFSGPFSDNVGFQCSTPRNIVSFGGQMTSSVLGLQQGHRMGNLMSSQWSTGEPSSFFSEFNGHNNPMSSPRQRIKEQTSNYNQIGSPIPSRVTTFGGMSPADASFYLQPNGMNPTDDIVLLNSLNSPQVSQTRPMSSPRQRVKEHTSNYNQIGSPIPSRATTFDGMSPADALFYLQPNGMNSRNDSVLMNSLNSPQVSQTRPPHWNVESLVYGLPTTDGLTRASPNFRLGGPEAFTSEDSFIIQGEGINYVVNSGLDRAKGQRRSALCNLDVNLERSQQDGRHQIAPSCENSRNRRVFFPFSSPVKYNSLPEIQGCIGLIAMDQHGCRFLQRMLDEGTPEDVQTIFNEIIENVVELMMNPFGNYLMQKMLEVCNEEQRMQIVVMVTARPRELVRISLNNHGTRAVQKLIETLKTRQQISLVISALEPGFLSLIKDVNGNHVVQRCLQCLSIEDNKFIFAGSARFCVDIATHQHGCCVLQRCIARSTGVHQENLVAEILANAHLLSQDNYGNYVVQFVMDLNIPSATSTLVSQFQGSYVYLSMQKFSSHVVEKCLIVGNDEDRSKIIHELLASSLFEQLLRDPLANYVIQKALEFSQGAIYKLLVEAIEPYRSRLRNCPYSKRIFSSKLLKK